MVQMPSFLMRDFNFCAESELYTSAKQGVTWRLKVVRQHLELIVK